MSKATIAHRGFRDNHPQLSAQYLTPARPSQPPGKDQKPQSAAYTIILVICALVLLAGLGYAVVTDKTLLKEAVAWLQTQWPLILLTCGLCLLTVYPVFSYLYFSWPEKRYEILNSLTPDGKRKYLCLFQKDPNIDRHKPVEDQFADMYDHAFGRWRYAFPILFLCCAVAGDGYVLAQNLRTLDLSTAEAQLSMAAAAATGAYTYVTFDLILRQQRRDLSPADVLRGGLRLAVGIPLGMAFGWVLATDRAFLAFAIGVFPLDTIALVLRRLLNKKLGLEIGVDGGDDQVASLSGVDPPTADRIQQADITTITQLAWCDPVQLSMRSNLSFAYVTDIVSQALAYVYFGKKLHDLAPLGLRSAFEIRFLWLTLNGDNADQANDAKAVLELAATTLGIGLKGVITAFEQIAEDPCTIFIYDTFGAPQDS